MLSSNLFRQSKFVDVSATAVTVGAMLLLPFLIHFIPSTAVPIGARLLPMFYAPLLAAIFFRPAVGIVSALVAPLLNYALTGMPESGILAILIVELVVFTVVMQRLSYRWPTFGGFAPFAYLIAKIVSLLVLILVPLSFISAPPMQFFLVSSRNALPGIAVLLVLNMIAVWVKRRSNGE